MPEYYDSDEVEDEDRVDAEPEPESPATPLTVPKSTRTRPPATPHFVAASAPSTAFAIASRPRPRLTEPPRYSTEPTPGTSAAVTAKAIARTRRNVHIHRLYVRHEHDACLALIEEVLAEFDGLCEYPIYVKALVQRRRGRIQESLQLFQAATALNPHNVQNLKQVGRSLYLLGKHKAAVEVYEEAEKMAAEARGDDGGHEDWEIYHQKGLCYARSKQFGAAAECFMRANAVSRHEATYEQLGRVYQAQENWEAAIATYLEALESSPDSPDILATLGLLYLRLGETYRAFEYLDQALSRDPGNPRVILAAGSIIQDHDDVDVALVKYRVAAAKEPNSAQLWNNVGMCFFGKNRFVAAIACLKKALYLDPFEWIISYNLGLAHLKTQQHASAFHVLSGCVKRKPDFAAAYAFLAVALAKLDDVENAKQAYARAIRLDPGDHLTRLNAAITLFNAGDFEGAKEMFEAHDQLWGALDEDGKVDAGEDVEEQRRALRDALYGS
jgi:Bardet-Biedl syndrome 4 protein